MSVMRNATVPVGRFLIGYHDTGRVPRRGSQARDTCQRGDVVLRGLPNNVRQVTFKP